MSYNYSNDRRNAAGAIPVYIVPTPPIGPPWPNKQNNGGIPVSFGAAPIAADSGPIPVRVVATGSAPDAEGRWPNDQGQNAGAIPVYNSPVGMPVWDVGIAPINPPVNVVLPRITPAGSVSPGATLSMSTGLWTNNPTSYMYTWRRNGVSIVGASANTYTTTVADAGTTIDGVMLAINSVGSGIGTLTANQVFVNLGKTL
jgi:hypothetical protein